MLLPSNKSTLELEGLLFEELVDEFVLN